MSDPVAPAPNDTPTPDSGERLLATLQLLRAIVLSNEQRIGRMERLLDGLQRAWLAYVDDVDRGAPPSR